MSRSHDFIKEARKANAEAAEREITKRLGMKPVGSMTCEEMLQEIALWDCLYEVPARSDNPRRAQQQDRKEPPVRFMSLCERYIAECLEQGNVEQFFEMLATYFKIVRCKFGECTKNFWALAGHKCLRGHGLEYSSFFVRPIDITPPFILERLGGDNKWKDDPIIQTFLDKFTPDKGSFSLSPEQQQQSQGGGGAKKRAKVQASQELPSPLWRPRIQAAQPPPLVQRGRQVAGGGGAASSAAVQRQQQQQQAKRQQQAAGQTDT